MKFYIRMCFMFFGLASVAFGDIDFQECDSHDVEIDRIDMEACHETPCPVIRGRSYSILVHPDEIHAWVDDINVSARAVIRGASFPVVAYAVNAGIIHHKSDTPLQIMMSVHPSLLRGPAPLIINTTYLHNGVPTCRFCFEFDVQIF